MNPANYAIVRDDYMQGGPLVIRDTGPWNRHATVTNDAEGVVARLSEQGLLAPTQRLFYYDSEGVLGELLHDALGRFLGFAPATKEEAG